MPAIPKKKQHRPKIKPIPPNQKTIVDDPPKTGKRGRPRKRREITVADLVSNLAAIGCTLDELVSITGIPEQSLTRNYGDTIKKSRHELHASIRRTQVDLALAGNVTMLIWLGKQMLGQRERHEAAPTEDGTKLSYSQLIAYAAKVSSTDIERKTSRGIEDGREGLTES